MQFAIQQTENEGGKKWWIVLWSDEITIYLSGNNCQGKCPSTQIKHGGGNIWFGNAFHDDFQNENRAVQGNVVTAGLCSKALIIRKWCSHFKLAKPIFLFKLKEKPTEKIKNVVIESSF